MSELLVWEDEGGLVVEEPAEVELVDCPTCGGLGGLLGGLGKRFWFRCEACGMDFSREVK